MYYFYLWHYLNLLVSQVNWVKPRSASKRNTRFGWRKILYIQGCSLCWNRFCSQLKGEEHAIKWSGCVVASLHRKKFNPRSINTISLQQHQITQMWRRGSVSESHACLHPLKNLDKNIYKKQLQETIRLQRCSSCMKNTCLFLFSIPIHIYLVFWPITAATERFTNWCLPCFHCSCCSTFIFFSREYLAWRTQSCICVLCHAVCVIRRLKSC